ncbi:hypothetical protein GYMLUDRAFT_119039, partial [Collybiopsis luxurians FD-317 M1]
SNALAVRIHPMPTCMYIPSRFTNRVDALSFCTFDTRIFSPPEYEGPPTVIAETSACDAPYECVRLIS